MIDTKTLRASQQKWKSILESAHKIRSETAVNTKQHEMPKISLLIVIEVANIVAIDRKAKTDIIEKPA